MRRPGPTITVNGPRGESIDVKFCTDDGSVRFRLNEAGPMVIRYAFLPGRQENVIVELVPKTDSPWYIGQENE